MMSAIFTQMMDKKKFGWKRMRIFYAQNILDISLWFQPSFVHVMDCYNYLINNCKQIHILNLKRHLFFDLYKQMDTGSQNIWELGQENQALRHFLSKLSY